MPRMMNVLIVRTSSMGDLIHTWPALTDLARHVPDLEITWLAEENFADIARLHPAVGAVIPMAWRRWRKNLFASATWDEMNLLKNRLQTTNWDVVVDAQGLLKSALPAWLAKGPVAGYNWRSIREPVASLLYSRKFDVSRNLSAVERNRQLFARIFGYTPTDKADFGILCGERPDWLPKRGYAVLLHATSRHSKEWPEEHWIGCGAQLFNRKGLISVIPWGNSKERARAERLAAALPDAVAAPRLGLAEAAGLLGHADAVIGVDTGLSHLANALDVPLVAIYTDTDPAKTGVIETPFAINLGGIGRVPSVEEVLDALDQRKGIAG